MKVQLAERMSRLGTETAFEVLAKVVDLRRKGRDIVSFCIGEPDFDTPQHIRDAGVKAIQGGSTHYGPPAGLPEFREAIAAHLTKRYGVPYSMDEIVVTPGGKAIIFYVMHALVEAGDEVIYPNPGYPIYESGIDFVGGKRVPLPYLESKGFSFDIKDLEKLISKKTKLVVINSPANPTGGVIQKADLERLAELAKEHGFWILSDEIYSDITYGEKFHSILQIPGMKERTILLHGFSKIYAMCGWRLGYGAMPKELVPGIAKLNNNFVACAATFTQLAGKAALEGSQEPSLKMVAEYKARRDLIVKLLNGIKGVRCHLPSGAFYVFANVTEACKTLGFKDSLDMEAYLLEKAGVAILSRMRFGRKNAGENDEYIRLSYATGTKEILEGLKRMKAAIEDPALAQAFLKSRR